MVSKADRYCGGMGWRRLIVAMSIDQIFDMLSWNNEEEIQRQGIQEAKKIKQQFKPHVLIGTGG